jgi:hypothetical protein
MINHEVLYFTALRRAEGICYECEVRQRRKFTNPWASLAFETQLCRVLPWAT